MLTHGPVLFRSACVAREHLFDTSSRFLPQGMNQRNGTDVDAASSMKVFSSLGYKVRVYNDQTVAQMVQVLTAGTWSRLIRTNPEPLHTLIVSPFSRSPQCQRKITAARPRSSVFC